MNICFWNINNKDLTDYFEDLVSENDIDLLFIAESDLPPSYILKKLNKTSSDFYFCPNNICEKIKVYSKVKEVFFPLLQDSPRLIARQYYSNIIGQNITLICLHFQSKVNWSNEDQAAQSFEMKQFIDIVESTVGHKRTVVFGDFNMHPFDDGIIQTTGFHTTMERTIAKKLSRTVDGKSYTYFYNPMWSFLGDLGKGKVSGTIYYSPAKPISYHWNLFDQVILRPDLIDYLDNDYLDIITKIGSSLLLNKNNIIDSSNFSDHLPLKYSLTL